MQTKWNWVETKGGNLFESNGAIWKETKHRKEFPIMCIESNTLNTTGIFKMRGIVTYGSLL